MGGMAFYVGKRKQGTHPFPYRTAKKKNKNRIYILIVPFKQGSIAECISVEAMFLLPTKHSHPGSTEMGIF